MKTKRDPKGLFFRIADILFCLRLVFFPKRCHLKDQRAEFFTQLTQSIFHTGRDFRINGPCDDPVFLHRTQTVRQDLLADAVQIAPQFIETPRPVHEIPEDAKADMIYGGCNCGNCHITILPTGDIYACRRVEDSRVGNVFEDRLADVWLTSMEGYRKYDAFSKCSKCRLLAWCRGCPAVAKGTNGSYYAADPQCWADENGALFQ